MYNIGNKKRYKREHSEMASERRVQSMPQKQKRGQDFNDHQHNDRQHREDADEHTSPLEGANHEVDIEHDADELLDRQQGHRTIMPSFEHGEKYHEAATRDVELYIRTYNTLLRSSGEINLKALVQAHYNIDSSLHPDARSSSPDMSAFIYSVLRLPASIIHCNLLLLGQSDQAFLS